MRGLIMRAAVVAGAIVIVSGGATGMASASGAPMPTWSPTTSSGTFDYNPPVVTVGSSRSQTFTLENTGGAATSALTITLAGPTAFSIPGGGNSCTGTSLGPNKTCQVTVVYQPTSAGQADTATLTATSKKATATLNLTGTGTSVAASLAATANATPLTGNTPLNVSFTGKATGGTAPYTYSWDFGDGTTSSAQDPSHTYSTAGTYDVTLTVTDSAAPLPATATSTVVITAIRGPLAATASAEPLTGTAPLNVSFTGSATGGTAPYTYSWDFGDGTTSSAQDPSHTYSTAGTYDVTLTVTDSAAPLPATATSTVVITAS